MVPFVLSSFILLLLFPYIFIFPLISTVLLMGADMRPLANKVFFYFFVLYIHYSSSLYFLFIFSFFQLFYYTKRAERLLSGRIAPYSIRLRGRRLDATPFHVGLPEQFRSGSQQPGRQEFVESLCYIVFSGIRYSGGRCDRAGDQVYR